MNTNILRTLWSLVAELSPDKIAAVSYDLIVNGLLQQLKERFCLQDTEAADISDYLFSRETLVRELVLEYAI